MRRAFAFLNLFGIGCGVVGSFLLYWALAVKSTDFKLVTVNNNELAFCFEGKRVETGFGGPLIKSDKPCPNWDRTGPTAEIEANYPRAAELGIVLVVIGFLLQTPLAFAAVGDTSRRA
jgi:hypothetical protein